jgi:SM-20-related protein
MSVKHESLFSECVEHLLAKGWWYSDELFSKEMIVGLYQDAARLNSDGMFRPAKIGRSFNKMRAATVRTDHIYWIEDWEDGSSRSEYKAFLDDLRIYLNRSLMTAAQRFEGHYSIYSKGSYYKKHLDQNRNQKRRQFSCILYLTDWNKNSGGELVIYNRSDRTQLERKLEPKKGRFVCFVSSEIFHEVLPSLYQRFALSGWMRDDMVVLF